MDFNAKLYRQFLVKLTYENNQTVNTFHTNVSCRQVKVVSVFRVITVLAAVLATCRRQVNVNVNKRTPSGSSHEAGRKRFVWFVSKHLSAFFLLNQWTVLVL